MDAGSILATAVLLSLATFVLRAAWWWLVGLLLWGPPTFLAIALGLVIGGRADNGWVGFLAAVVIAATLRAAVGVAFALIARWSWSTASRIGWL